MDEITTILKAIESGRDGASEKLLPLVYNELRRLAAHRMKHEPVNHTLQPTALVHEAYIRLVGNDNSGWKNRAHFYAAAAEAMRRILVDIARRKQRLKHGGDIKRVEFNESSISIKAPPEQMLAVHEALDDFALVDQQAAQVVKMHYFTGMTMEETAKALNISKSSVYRNWRFARAWLLHRLSE